MLSGRGWPALHIAQVQRLRHPVGFNCPKAAKTDHRLAIQVPCDFEQCKCHGCTKGELAIAYVCIQMY